MIDTIIEGHLDVDKEEDLSKQFDINLIVG